MESDYRKWSVRVSLMTALDCCTAYSLPRQSSQSRWTKWMVACWVKKDAMFEWIDAFFLIDGGVTYSRFFAVNCRREEFCSRVVVRHMSVWSTVEPNGLSCVDMFTHSSLTGPRLFIWFASPRFFKAGPCKYSFLLFLAFVFFSLILWQLSWPPLSFSCEVWYSTFME